MDDSTSSQSGLVLPSPSVQNQIHELAKTLPAPRKQNTACDACRSRKVKCNKVPGQDKCQHCLSKSFNCTHYVQQATSEKKRVSGSARRPRNLSSSSVSPVAVKSTTKPLGSASPTGGCLAQKNVHAIPLPIRYGFRPPITLNSPASEVVMYLFSPPESGNYRDWGELACKLDDDSFKADFALDLVEVYFQIVHTRMPLLNPTQFRQRMHLGSSADSTNAPETPLHPALVATVIAWGSKFSEHPLLMTERQRPGGQSLVAKILIDRARELAEGLRVHRVASTDHIIIALLLEPLQSQTPDDPTGFHGFWLHNATRHLLDLQFNHKSTIANIQDPEARGTMIFAWWMACLCDSYGAAYYRRKPVLDDGDYDIDFYTADPVNHDIVDSRTSIPSSREQLEFLGYYRAAHALARISRTMARQLFMPVTDAEGIPFQILLSLSDSLRGWRDHYLTLVGVPTNFPAEWDFVSAVSACSSDGTYHAMWIILFNALDDFGVREQNDIRMGNGSPMINEQMKLQIEATKKTVLEEALHGALRIAGLAGILTSNGYLRLDPAVMHVSIIQAGTFLARLGRPEVLNCVGGLEQYRYSYEEAGDQATEMKRIYEHGVTTGERDLSHMLATVLASQEPSSQHHPSTSQSHVRNGMMIDTDNRPLGHGHSPHHLFPSTEHFS